MATTKEMIAQVQSMTLEQGLEYAAMTNAAARSSQDCIKGVQAFLNKTEIQW